MAPLRSAPQNTAPARSPSNSSGMLPPIGLLQGAFYQRQLPRRARRSCSVVSSELDNPAVSSDAAVTAAGARAARAAEPRLGDGDLDGPPVGRVVAPLDEPAVDELVDDRRRRAAGDARGGRRARSCGSAPSHRASVRSARSLRPRHAERPEVAVGGDADAAGRPRPSRSATSALRRRPSAHAVREYIGPCR